MVNNFNFGEHLEDLEVSLWGYSTDLFSFTFGNKTSPSESRTSELKASLSQKEASVSWKSNEYKAWIKNLNFWSMYVKLGSDTNLSLDPR